MRPGWGHGDENHEHTGPPGQTGDKNNCKETGKEREREKEKGKKK